MKVASMVNPGAAREKVMSQSQMHFQETIVQLRKLHKSYLAHDNQHAKAVKSHAAILADLEKDDLEEDELDAKVLEAEKVSKRASWGVV